jgi:DMSO/TMAO reductase YedYZ molybdopterin-dependent catalytic subunit
MRISRFAAICSTILIMGIGCKSTRSRAAEGGSAGHADSASAGASGGRAADAGNPRLAEVGPDSGVEWAVDAPRCRALPAVMPTLPAVIPQYLEVDPATGLHITGDYQVIDPATWRLKVTGKVEHPLSLRYEDLYCLPRAVEEITIVCRGFFEDTATFSGVTLPTLLAAAGVLPEADSILLKGADGYSAEVPLESARSEDNLVAYEWEGQPLPILHGFPARALFPHMPGSASVKWLLEIEVTTAP